MLFQSEIRVEKPLAHHSWLSGPIKPITTIKVVSLSQLIISITSHCIWPVLWSIHHHTTHIKPRRVPLAAITGFANRLNRCSVSSIASSQSLPYTLKRASPRQTQRSIPCWSPIARSVARVRSFEMYFRACKRALTRRSRWNRSVTWIAFYNTPVGPRCWYCGCCPICSSCDPFSARLTCKCLEARPSAHTEIVNSSGPDQVDTLRVCDQ